MIACAFRSRFCFSASTRSEILPSAACLTAWTPICSGRLDADAGLGVGAMVDAQVEAGRGEVGVRDFGPRASPLDQMLHRPGPAPRSEDCRRPVDDVAVAVAGHLVLSREALLGHRRNGTMTWLCGFPSNIVQGPVRNQPLGGDRSLDPFPGERDVLASRVSSTGRAMFISIAKPVPFRPPLLDGVPEVGRSAVLAAAVDALAKPGRNVGRQDQFGVGDVLLALVGDDLSVGMARLVAARR